MARSTKFPGPREPFEGEWSAPDREEDLNALNERHRRRVLLMQMQGDTNKLETRMYICYAIAGVLAILALILSGM